MSKREKNKLKIANILTTDLSSYNRNKTKCKAIVTLKNENNPTRDGFVIIILQVQL